MLCDRVAIIDHGRILELDSPANLVRGLDAPTRITVAAGQLSKEEAGAIPGVDDVDDDAAGDHPPHPPAGRRAHRARRAAAPGGHLGADRHPRGRLPVPHRPRVPRMIALPRPQPGHRPRLRPRQGVGVLRDRLPADVPGALRRPVRRPDHVEGRHGAGRRRRVHRRHAGRGEGGVRGDLRHHPRGRPRRRHRGGQEGRRRRRGRDAGRHPRRPLHADRPGEGRGHPGRAPGVRRRHQRRPVGQAADLPAARPSASRTTPSRRSSTSRPACSAGRSR